MMNGTNGLVDELKRLLALASDEAPYCVLSRRQVAHVVEMLGALGDVPTGDPWLEQIEDSLTPIEYRIYKTLYDAKEGVVAMDTVWELSRARTVNSLWAHMRRLRDKCVMYGLGEIETVRSKGYMLVLPESKTD